MLEKPIKIKFKNQVNPKSAFDLIQLEELFQRTTLEHNPENLHKVDFFIMILITEGKGIHTIDFTDYEYEKGTLLTIRKDQIHKFFKSKKPSGYLLLFTDDFLISYLEKSEAEKAIQLFNELLSVPKIQLSDNDFLMVKNIVSRIENEYLNETDDHALSIIRSELNILTSKLFRIKAKQNPMVFNKKYLSAFIEFQRLVENNTTKSSRVSYYASLMGISTKTLNTISQSMVNKTAKEFIDEICTKQIKRLLINTTLSIKEIAYASGFEETTNFYKYFKRQTETTPEQFRSKF